MTEQLLNGMRVANMSVRYRDQVVLDNITLPTLVPGEVTVLIGPNAAGKSTLLRSIAGLQRASGEVWLHAQNLTTLPQIARARKMAYLPQNLPDSVKFEVFESILSAAMAGRVNGMMGQRADAAVLQQVDDILVRLKLKTLASRSLDALSGGQRQLVGLAQAFVRQPEVLLLDEPTSALDLYHQFEVIELVKKETRERGLITVMILHDMNLALECADRILVLHHGRLAACGVPQAVLNRRLLKEVYRVDGDIEMVKGRAMLWIGGAIREHDNA